MKQCDLNERLEKLGRAIDSIELAVDDLKRVYDADEDYITSLESLLADMIREQEELEEEATREYREEQREMERAYWLAVI